MILLSDGTVQEITRLPGAPGISGINTGMFDSVASALSRTDSRAVVLDLDERRAAGEVTLPSRPETGIIADEGRKLYVALSGSDQVAVIDMRRWMLTKLIDGVGREPWAVNMVGALSYCH
jgi:YVTN family beta-propeller protein